VCKKQYKLSEVSFWIFRVRGLCALHASEQLHRVKNTTKYKEWRKGWSERMHHALKTGNAGLIGRKNAD